MNYIEAKAPGKIILVGEHSVVYGYEAILASINLYAYAKLTPRDDNVIKFFLKDYNLEKSFTIKSFDYFCKKLIRLKDSKEPEDLMQKETILREQKEVLSSLAIYFTAKNYNYKFKKGFDLEIHSDIPQGGLGSSTAVGCSTIKVFLKFIGEEENNEQILKMLIQTEEIYYDTVSGADQTVVTYGGFIKYRKDNGNSSIKRVDLDSKILKNCLIIDSGTPENLTGEVVKEVKKLWDHKRDNVKSIFKALDLVAKRVVKTIINNDLDSFLHLIRRAGGELEKLGIVRPSTLLLIRRLEQFGANIKITGAGAVNGEGSGALLCFAKDLTLIKKYLKEHNVRYYEVALGK